MPGPHPGTLPGRRRREAGQRRSSTGVDAVQGATRIGRTLKRANPRCWKNEPEARPLAHLAVHFQLAAVALRDVLDDRQPEAGAAGVARAAAVHAIKALGQTWN